MLCTDSHGSIIKKISQINGKKIMIPIILIVGKTNSGKTTLIEKLIPELNSLGLDIGTIKHDAHDNFQMDHEGKDTYRHKQAGAKAVLISSSKKLALISDTDKEFSLDELASTFFNHIDLILTEGYKSKNKPKIEVIDSEQQDEHLCHNDDNLIAFVCDKEQSLDVPVFRMEETTKLAEFIIKKIFPKRRSPQR